MRGLHELPVHRNCKIRDYIRLVSCNSSCRRKQKSDSKKWSENKTKKRLSWTAWPKNCKNPGLLDTPQILPFSVCFLQQLSSPFFRARSDLAARTMTTAKFRLLCTFQTHCPSSELLDSFLCGVMVQCAVCRNLLLCCPSNVCITRAVLPGIIRAFPAKSWKKIIAKSRNNRKLFVLYMGIRKSDW